MVIFKKVLVGPEGPQNLHDGTPTLGQGTWQQRCATEVGLGHMPQRHY